MVELFVFDNDDRNNGGGLRRTRGEWFVQRDETAVGKEKDNQVHRWCIFVMCRSNEPNGKRFDPYINAFGLCAFGGSPQTYSQ
jgi:hypothetical protein